MRWRSTAALTLFGLLAVRPALAGPKDDAARAFAEGARLYRAEDYTAAIAAFERAYKLKPHHVVLCNIARAHERLADFVAAAKHFQRCLDEGADAGPEATKVRALLDAVQGRIGRLLVQGAAGSGTVYVDGELVGLSPQSVPVNPGPRTVELRREGARPARQTVEARAGETITVTLELVEERPPPAPEPPAPEAAAPSPAPEPEPAPARPARRGLWQGWFWGGTALTAGLAVVAVVLGVQALDLKSSYEEAPTREGYERARDRRTLTNVFWGAAAAAGAATTVLFFYTDFRARDESVVLGFGLRGTF